MDTQIIDSSTLSHYDESEDKLIIERVQNCEPIIIQNKIDADGFVRFGEMCKVASIPLVLVEKWRNEEGVDILKPGHEDFLARKLLDPDYAYLRTTPNAVRL